ncbi:MAG: hypothetical protein GXO90_10820 [FCB group bacterium]|nr:hypothetical protein [FCB group bacterium]
MNRLFFRKISALLLLSGFLSAQVFFSGWINPSDMRRTSDGSRINLPFRTAELELNYALSNFEFRSRTAVESRWGMLDRSRIQYREAYLVWYPSWGEFKAGKQIYAWGLADGNNPTDNLNPYDYYYLFLTGIDRKVASLSAAATFYLGDAELDLVFLPRHEANRFPFNEPDFPIPLPPKPDHILKPDRDWESGMRLKTAFGNWDVDLSWFHGNDRSFSVQGMTVQMIMDSAGYPQPLITPYMGYNRSDAVGGGFVWFPGNITLRGEGMWVRSEAPKNNLDYSTRTRADYLQYVLQGEINAPLDLTVMVQYIGTRILEHSFAELPPLPLPNASQFENQLHLNDYQPGLGTPFAIVAENGLMLGASGNYLDNRLEVRLNGFKDLDNVGIMAGGGLSYSPIEAWSLDLDGVWFFGDSDDPENRFAQLESFSNLRLGIKYSF